MKRLLAWMFLLLPSVMLRAEDISERQAQQIANQFLNARTTLQGAHKAPGALKLAYRPEGGAQPEFYVFNNADDQGYVIVGGDDRLPQLVLGYTDSGPFDYDQAPDALKVILAGYAADIDRLRQKGLSALQPAKVSITHNPVVEPLIKTKWNQGYPYNALCPTADSRVGTIFEGRCPSGCVAVAVGQILNFWRTTPSGQHTNTHLDTQTVDFSQSAFDWNNMKDHYDGSETSAQRDAVAKLMYDVGCAVNMNYRPSASGAYSQYACEAFHRFFGMSEHDIAMTGKGENIQNTLAWELSHGRPVYYAAVDADDPFGSNAHALVCDGYDQNYYFHFNFGWGGQSDGYYLVSLWDRPSDWYEQYNLINYRYSISIITGIQPREYQKVCIDGVFYEIVSDGEAMVSSSDGTVELPSNLTIPATVTIDGKSYSVAGFSSNIFREYNDGNPMNTNTVKHLTLGIKDIPDNLMAGCTSLTRLTLTDDVETIGQGAFKDCINLGYIDSWPQQLQEVPDEAFRGCSLWSVPAFSASVKHFGKNSFRGVSRVEFLGKDFVVDEGAFASALTAKGIENAAQIGPGGFSHLEGGYTMNRSCIYAEGAVSADTIFIPSNTPFQLGTATARQSYEVGKSHPLLSSHDGILYNKSRTTIKKFPSGRDFSSLNVISGVKTIDDNPGRLLYLTLPASIETINSRLGGDKVREVTIMASTPPVVTRSDCFDPIIHAYGQSVLKVPVGSKSAYEQAPVWKDFNNIREEVAVQGNLIYSFLESTSYATVIGRNPAVSFDGHVKIPNQVTVAGTASNVYAIEPNAFCNDPDLLTVTLSTSSYIQSYGGNTFGGSDQLYAINVPADNSDCQSTPDGMLTQTQWGDQYLTFCPPRQLVGGQSVERNKVEIPGSINYLDFYSFADNLKRVVIPTNVTHFEPNAFALCTRLKAVYLKATTSPTLVYRYDSQGEVLEHAFNPAIYGSCTVYVPRGSLSNFKNHDLWYRFAHIEEYDPNGPLPGWTDDDADEPEQYDQEPAATRTALVVLTKDNTRQRFELSQRPVVTIAGTDLTITSTGSVVTIPLSTVVRYTFEVSDATGVTDVEAQHESIDYDGDRLMVSGLREGDAVRVYTLDGKQVLSQTARHAGICRVQLHALPRGAYIVRVNSLSYKIMKR